MAPKLSPEFALLAACCRWPPCERRQRAVRAAIGHGIDWALFLRLVKRHRVAGLAHNGLASFAKDMPASVARELAGLANGVALQNLTFAAETSRLQRLFDDAGTGVIFLKGAALAQLAYGGLGVKHSWDIDLLVEPQAVPGAVKLLQHAGYHLYPALPLITESEYARWISINREHQFFHETSSVYVEMHWKLADNPHILSNASANPATQMVRLSKDAAADIRTLGDDALFNYLCVHGALHAWSRLKWLADFAALISQTDEAELERRLAHARMLGVDRCVAQALLLADRLFSLPQAGVLTMKLRKSALNRWLELVALRAMSLDGNDKEFHERPLATALARVSAFFLGRGWRYVIQELKADQNRVPLPQGFGFLYPIVRVPVWIGRRLLDKESTKPNMPSTPSEKRAAMIRD